MRLLYKIRGVRRCISFDPIRINRDRLRSHNQIANCFWELRFLSPKASSGGFFVTHSTVQADPSLDTIIIIITNCFVLASRTREATCDRRTEKNLITSRHGVISVSGFRTFGGGNLKNSSGKLFANREAITDRACGAHLLSPSIWSVGHAELAGVIIAHGLLPPSVAPVETKALWTGEPSASTPSNCERLCERRSLSERVWGSCIDFSSIPVSSGGWH